MLRQSRYTRKNIGKARNTSQVGIRNGEGDGVGCGDVSVAAVWVDFAIDGIGGLGAPWLVKGYMAADNGDGVEVASAAAAAAAAAATAAPGAATAVGVIDGAGDVKGTFVYVPGIG